MIAKLTTGNGFGGAIRYDMKFGSDNSSMSVLLGLSGVDFSYDDEGNIKIDPRQIAFDFRQQALCYRTPDSDNARGVRKPVYHWVLSWRPGEHTTDAEKLDVAKDFMQRIGFVDTQYMISAHYDKAHEHLHIVANIVNNRGERIPTLGLIDKAHKAAAAITRERGYQWGEKATEKTIENAHRPHEKVRYIITPVVLKAVYKARSFDELKVSLKNKGIVMRIKTAQDGKRGGVSFACKYEGQVHTFSGSSLNRYLSYSKISAKFQRDRDKEAELAETTDFSTLDFRKLGQEAAEESINRRRNETWKPVKTEEDSKEPEDNLEDKNDTLDTVVDIASGLLGMVGSSGDESNSQDLRRKKKYNKRR
ncbi:MAG: relaxase/mobilization nuclease domain-containing protein [Bacteroidales bacterium]|nr:relaxase/mobilization nuclease domain-containing protein [Bacteroidales bacterium]